MRHLAIPGILACVVALSGSLKSAHAAPPVKPLKPGPAKTRPQPPKPPSPSPEMVALQRKLETASAELVASQARLRELQRQLEADPKSLTDEELATAEKLVSARFHSFDSERSRRTGPEKPLTPEELYKKCEGAVTSVTTTRLSGASTGTGFFYSAGCVLTNFHVAAQATAIRVSLPDGKSVDVKSVEWADRDADLALLRLDGNFVDAEGKPTHPIAEFEFRGGEPAVGAPIFVIGDPKGLQKTLTNGLVSGIREDEGFVKLIQISVPVSPGSSGSPVFNQFGRVIGIVTSSLTSGQNLNFCVPSDYARPGLVRLPMPLTKWVEFSRPPAPPVTIPQIDLGYVKRVSQDKEGYEALAARSLQNIGIVVEHLPEDLAGVTTTGELRAIAVDQLTRFLPWLKIDEANKPVSENPLGSYLYVRVSGLELASGTLVVTWRVELNRYGYLANPRGGEEGPDLPLDNWPERGAVWSKSGLLTGPASTMTDRLEAEIKIATLQFARLASVAKVR